MAEAGSIENDIEHPTGAGKPSTGKEEKGAVKDGKKHGPVADHKETIIVILTLVGVVIGWFSYKSSKNSSAASASTAGTSTGTLGAGSATSGSGTDSTGSVSGYGGDTNASAGLDAYLSQLSGEISALQGQLTPIAASTAKTPSATPAAFQYGAAAAGDKYIEDNATGAVYQVQKGGIMFHLNRAQVAAIGKPAQTPTRYGTAPKKKAPAPAPKKTTPTPVAKNKVVVSSVVSPTGVHSTG